MNYITTLIFSLLCLNAYTQTNYCSLFNRVNKDFFDKKYNEVYFLETTAPLLIENKKYFEVAFMPVLSKDIINKIYLSSKRGYGNQKKWHCLFDTIKIINRERIGMLLKRNEFISIDSNQEHSIVKRINEIMQLKESPDRDSVYNEYMRTQEVVDFRNKKNFNAVRIVELTEPVFIKEYALIQIVIKTGVNESTGFLALYRKNNADWQLIKSALH